MSVTFLTSTIDPTYKQKELLALSMFTPKAVALFKLPYLMSDLLCVCLLHINQGVPSHMLTRGKLVDLVVKLFLRDENINSVLHTHNLCYFVHIILLQY